MLYFGLLTHVLQHKLIFKFSGKSPQCHMIFGMGKDVASVQNYHHRNLSANSLAEHAWMRVLLLDRTQSL